MNYKDSIYWGMWRDIVEYHKGIYPVTLDPGYESRVTKSAEKLVEKYKGSDIENVVYQIAYFILLHHLEQLDVMSGRVPVTDTVNR